MLTWSSARALCALLFLIITAQSNAQSNSMVEITEGAPLSVQCTLLPDQPAEWLLNGSVLPVSVRAQATQREEVASTGGGVLSQLDLGPATQHHAGSYTCAPGTHHTLVRVLPRSRSGVTPAGDASPTPSVADTGAPPAPLAAPAGAQVVTYDVGREIRMNCTLPRPNKQAVVWKRNGTEITAGDRIVIEDVTVKDTTMSVLRFVGKTTEDDYGNYSCAVDKTEAFFFVRGNIRMRLPANSNVVEGQNLKLTCKLIGKPYPSVTWMFSNDTVRNASVTELLGMRVSINTSDSGVEGGDFLLRDARRSDAGNYTCVIDEGAPIDVATTIVRVKDMYAALWPFLGICAEVFVLCAIILVYEKRRTKPELDDSDTDNHDQKKS